MADTANYDVLQGFAGQIRAKCDIQPEVAIMLGTGLGGVAAAIQAEATIPMADIEGMPTSTADTHAGDIILGTLEGRRVIAFSGRLHCYEGYSAADVVVPIRVARILGAHTLVMGSAVGGLNPQYQPSDIIVLEDHINFMGVNPLVGPNDDRLGSRWPDMIEPYSHDLIALSQQKAVQAGWALAKGVYISVLGPNLETRAEYRMLRQWGADMVGMSTVPETIAAIHAGMRVAAYGIITDLCLPDALAPANIEHILAAAGAAEPKLSQLIRDVIADLPQPGN